MQSAAGYSLATTNNCSPFRGLVAMAGVSAWPCDVENAGNTQGAGPQLPINGKSPPAASFSDIPAGLAGEDWMACPCEDIPLPRISATCRSTRGLTRADDTALFCVRAAGTVKMNEFAVFR